MLRTQPFKHQTETGNSVTLKIKQHRMSGTAEQFLVIIKINVTYYL